ncbi:MAG TPA: serine hydrolase domain-containing protein [Gemmataceae bacterium]|jgi:CubicO group peptidase (beta-lactamase class C family)|nr:serine hydrolase domain-containing protein [Gemmataceae bacterium]
MSVRRLLILGLVLTATTVQADSPAPGKLDGIALAMQKFVDANDLAGAVTVVGRGDGFTHETVVGHRDLAAKDPMRRDTLFRIASMTKPITAVGIMILVDEGKVNPDDDVAKYLPEFTGQLLVAERGKDLLTLKRPARPVKVRDLLTHTAGLAPYPPGVDDVYAKRNRTLAETTMAAALRPLEFEPGSKWAYSNPGIDTLGRIIEVVSGQSYPTFLKERVFDPLGMTDTLFYPTSEHLKRLAMTYGKDKDGHLVATGNSLIGLPPHPRHPIPAGGLISCAGDLSKLYLMMLHKGELNGKRILSEKSVAEMTKTQTGDIKTGFTEGMSYGFGFAVVKEPKGVTAMLSPGAFGHGGAFGTQGWIDPHKDLFVILLIQRTGLPNSDASPMRQALQELAVTAAK